MAIGLPLERPDMNGVCLRNPENTSSVIAGLAAGTKPGWYAALTRSRFEKTVRAEFEAQGIEHYLPTIQDTHQWKDRKRVVEQPIFPGYIFTRFADNPRERRKILQTRGVVSILGASGGIEPVPDRELEAIRRLLASGAPCFTHPFLQEGAWVRICRGTLKGIEGRLIRFKDRCRIVLSVEMLSRSVAAEIDGRDVEPVSAAAWMT